MNTFDEKSQKKLDTCHSELQKLFTEVNKFYRCDIIQGHKPRVSEFQKMQSDTSIEKFPYSKYNEEPSLAVNVMPIKYFKNVRDRYFNFAGYVQATADTLEILISWGGDNLDNIKDFVPSMHDLRHFELTGMNYIIEENK